MPEPRILPEVYQVQTVSFFGTVAAGARATLVSQRLSRPFYVQNIAASFALNTNRTLQLSFHLSPDDDAPTAGQPSGFNLLADVGQVDYIVGDDERKSFLHNAFSPTYPVWLKVHANNSDAFAHTIDAQITIGLVLPATTP